MEEDVRAALLDRYYKDSESLQLQEFVSEALDNFLQIIYPVHATMLAYQSPSLGLFPRGKSQHARVRDNIYCAAALWCFSLAYRYQLDQIGLVRHEWLQFPKHVNSLDPHTHPCRFMLLEAISLIPGPLTPSSF